MEQLSERTAGWGLGGLIGGGFAGRWLGLACGIILCASVTGAARADEHDEDEPEWFIEGLEIGGSIELEYERKREFDLDRRSRDDLDLMPFEAVLEIFYQPNDYFEVYIQPNFARDIELQEEGVDKERNNEFSFEEAYVTLSEPDLGLSLQFGRLFFGDEREWVFDEALDGVRGAIEWSDFFLELSWSQESLVDVDLLNPDETEPVNNYVAYGGYELSEDITLGAYGILRDDLDFPENEPLFLGVYSFGTVGERFDYWLDAAHVRGKEEDRTLRGYGIDLLGTYHFDAPLSPHMVLGYAFGSGDSGGGGGGHDDAFRQTDLQGNEHDFAGLNKIKYYGEVFDPELSNLIVFTAGLGIEPYDGIALDLIYHHYRQDVASDEIRDTDLEADPTGRNRTLGDEFDLVVGFEAIEDFRITGYLGYFMPGSAFEKGADNAFLARIELEYEF